MQWSLIRIISASNAEVLMKSQCMFYAEIEIKSHKYHGTLMFTTE